MYQHKIKRLLREFVIYEISERLLLNFVVWYGHCSFIGVTDLRHTTAGRAYGSVPTDIYNGGHTALRAPNYEFMESFVVGFSRQPRMLRITI